MRCVHEASLHSENTFLTLTYGEESLPPGGSLDRQAFPLFMKRLRRAIEPRKVRYFHVGEYGSRTERPHYHALLFGFEAPDRKLFTVRRGYPVYTSEMVSELWPAGLHELGNVTPASAGYVAKYVRKRLTGKWAQLAYGDREPEYATMSRNPGIGAGWIERYKDEVYACDSVRVGGVAVKPPRFYDSRVAEEVLEEIKFARWASRNREEETPERLSVREVVHVARDSLEKGGVL